MKTIDEWVYSTLKNDATLLGYTGGSESDPRVYAAHIPVELFTKFTGVTGAAVSYYLSGGGGFSLGPIWALQEPDERYSIDIYSRSKSVVASCFERIDAMLNEELQASIIGWKVLRISRVAQIDLYLSDDHIRHKHLEYLFAGILDAS
jgi:hypothetical protein